MQFNYIKTRTNHKQATELIKQLGDGWRLPTIEELRVANKYGDLSDVPIAARLMTSDQYPGDENSMIVYAPFPSLVESVCKDANCVYGGGAGSTIPIHVMLVKD